MFWVISVYFNIRNTLPKSGTFLLGHSVYMKHRCWRGTLNIKWTDRITNDEVFERAKEERLLLKILKDRRHSWVGHTIRHNEFVVNILEGAISGKKDVGRP